LDLASGPDLVGDHDDHEYEVDAESPEDGKFGDFQMSAGDVAFLNSDELIMLERG
jgi:hypothetical protein